MTEGVPIPLERYVLEKIADLDARVELRRLATKEALALQAKEYERRLRDLNNSHETAVRVQNTFATKETVEREIRLLSDRVGKLEIARADREGTSKIIWALWGFAGAVAGGLLILFATKAWN